VKVRSPIIMTLVVLLATSIMSCGRPERVGPADSTGTKGAREIRELVEKLRGEGIKCADLFIEEPSQPPAPETSSVGGTYSGPTAIAVGYCTLASASEFQGVSLDSRILVFETADHLRQLPPPEAFPGQSLVYRSMWEFYVSPASAARDVRAILGGQILRGTRLPNS
jgi:hypothetical protein